jgi:hypothetical protein
VRERRDIMFPWHNLGSLDGLLLVAQDLVSKERAKGWRVLGLLGLRGRGADWVCSCAVTGGMERVLQGMMLVRVIYKGCSGGY